MKQLTFKKVSGWGGARKGAGRKNQSGQVNHMKRDKVEAKFPMHLTLKMKPGLKSLRSPKMTLAFKESLSKAKAKGLRVIHFALESNHAHLFTEANDNGTLRSGMASLGSSFGKAVRKINDGKGSVFDGRYHVRVLKTPRETKHAMAYVLLNHSKHQKTFAYQDEKSSAFHFGEWRTLLGEGYRNTKTRALPECLSEPKSWLARTGWRKG